MPTACFGLIFPGIVPVIACPKPLDRTAPLRQRAMRPENDQAEGNRGCKV